MAKKIIFGVLGGIFTIFYAFFGSFADFDTCLADENTPPYKAMTTMEVQSGRALYSYNAEEKLPMASTTKIITAIYVIEHTQNVDELVEIPKEAQGVEGSSIYLRAGEHLSVLELLYGLMLQSGNDAAVALAINNAGNVENFCRCVNEWLLDIGILSTHIVTPNGLHDDNHYTTAYDLARISCYAMRNDIFRKIVSTKKIAIANELKDEPRYIVNKNKLLKTLDGCTGIKTGYTKKAGRCLVASQNIDGMEVVTVVLNCGPMFEECTRLLEKAHAEYTMTDILAEYNHIGVLEVETKKGIEKVNVVSKTGFTYPLTDEEKTRLRIVIDLPEHLIAPVNQDDIVGEIKIYVSNQLLFSAKIYTIESVKEITLSEIYKKVIEKML